LVNAKYDSLASKCRYAWPKTHSFICSQFSRRPHPTVSQVMRSHVMEPSILHDATCSYFIIKRKSAIGPKK
jgi:hypothetical protein